MADAKAPTLPMPSESSASQANVEQLAVDASQVNSVAEASPRELLISGAVMLVLMVAFFLAKSAYSTWLVGRRVQPHSANAAGWSLYMLLTLSALAVVLAVVRRAWLESALFAVPLGLIMLVLVVILVRTSQG